MRASIAVILLVTVVAAGACRATGGRTGAPGSAAEGESTGDPPATGAGTRNEAAHQAPPIVQPGAPGEPTRVISAEEAADIAGSAHTEADVRFMQGMIHHHAQALDMTALVPDRTEREDLRLLAQRIELSQQDEIGMMQRWLELRGEEAPTAHDHHGAGAPMMPGMLTAEEMERLAAADGPAFERLFLESMIRHHQGALVMVDELYATPGAGQETNVAAFTAEVVADQGAEIARMNAMLNEMIKEPRQ
jgi:uncharacterized protein (DUF305 family)